MFSYFCGNKVASLHNLINLDAIENHCSVLFMCYDGEIRCCLYFPPPY